MNPSKTTSTQTTLQTTNELKPFETDQDHSKSDQGWNADSENEEEEEENNEEKEDPENETSKSDTPNTQEVIFRSVSQECSICLEETDCIFLCQTHAFCKTCIEQYLNERITTGRVAPLNCAGRNCTHEIPEALIYHHTSDDLFQKYFRFRNNAELEKNPLIRWCPTPDCASLLLSTGIKKQLSCAKCLKLYCRSCGELSHKYPCWINRRGKNVSHENSRNQSWMSKKTKKCPKCKVRIEKNQGCPHMRCTHCQHEFCWNCLRDYKTHDVCRSHKEEVVGVVLVVGAVGFAVACAALPPLYIAVPVGAALAVAGRKGYKHIRERLDRRRRQEEEDSDSSDIEYFH